MAITAHKQEEAEVTVRHAMKPALVDLYNGTVKCSFCAPLSAMMTPRKSFYSRVSFPRRACTDVHRFTATGRSGSSTFSDRERVARARNGITRTSVIRSTDTRFIDDRFVIIGRRSWKANARFACR